jgi:hypothetical protein
MDHSESTVVSHRTQDLGEHRLTRQTKVELELSWIESERFRKERKEPSKRRVHALDEYGHLIMTRAMSGLWSAQRIADLLNSRHRLGISGSAIRHYVEQILGLRDCFDPAVKRQNRLAAAGENARGDTQ